MFWRKNKIDTIVRIYESEIQAIVAESQRHPRSETGGDLYGTFTHGNQPVIWLASGPGPKARHLATHFEQDASFITYWQDRLMRDFGIQYVGSWHSHHVMDLDQPSGGDVHAARTYAIKHGRHRTLEIIVNHERRKPVTSLRPYFYPNAQEEGWVPACFDPLNGESPVRHRLGCDELRFSAGVNWKDLAGGSSYKLEVHQVRGEISEIPFTDDKLELPVELQSAIQNLNRGGIEIEQRGPLYMVVIPITDRHLIAVAVQGSPTLSIAQVNLIDESGNTNITDVLRRAGLVLTIDEYSIDALTRIANFVQRQLEERRTR